MILAGKLIDSDFYSFSALNLVPFNINPHYLDADANSKHKGETRETRIDEFHALNETPVVGLREGTCILFDGEKATLLGSFNARLFRRFFFLNSLVFWRWTNTPTVINFKVVDAFFFSQEQGTRGSCTKH